VLLEIMVDFASQRVKAVLSDLEEEGELWLTVVRSELTPMKFYRFMGEQEWRKDMDGPSYTDSWLRWSDSLR
jgi:hypothetical protein